MINLHIFPSCLQFLLSIAYHRLPPPPLSDQFCLLIIPLSNNTVRSPSYTADNPPASSLSLPPFLDPTHPLLSTQPPLHPRVRCTVNTEHDCDSTHDRL